uniref:Uncharacterized protein n=1 Tax=Oryza nivara TaxID=4536 RepID=A0A0E0G493_ORYNI
MMDLAGSGRYCTHSCRAPGSTTAGLGSDGSMMGIQRGVVDSTAAPPRVAASAPAIAGDGVVDRSTAACSRGSELAIKAIESTIQQPRAQEEVDRTIVIVGAGRWTMATGQAGFGGSSDHNGLLP